MFWKRQGCKLCICYERFVFVVTRDLYCRGSWHWLLLWMLLSYPHIPTHCKTTFSILLNECHHDMNNSFWKVHA
jgi:hypothetical protein